MKKLWLIFGLALILTAGGGQGYYGCGNSPAYGQPPPYYAPPYNNPYYYPPPANYNNYYSAPYADPLSQFLYYAIPQISGEGEEEEWEHRGREYYEPRREGREGFERGEHGRERH